MSKLDLFFVGGKTPELIESRFSHPLLSLPAVGVRGGAVPSHLHPFKWGTSAQVLSLFFVRAVRLHAEGRINEPILEGYKGTPVQALKRLLARSRHWLLDIFGIDSSGRTLLSRTIQFTNFDADPRWPTRAYLRTQSLQPSAIRIHLDGKLVDRYEELITLEESLLTAWRSSYKPDRAKHSARNLPIAA